MKSAKDIIIFDIDGTLANTEHRSNYVRTKPKNWPRFFDEMYKDPVHEHVAMMAKHLFDLDYDIYLVSGRPENYRDMTEKWLLSNDIMYNKLFMRAEKDSRGDDIVKKEIFDKYFTGMKDRILCVFDDRPRVIRMWRSEGIPVFNCGDGTEF